MAVQRYEHPLCADKVFRYIAGQIFYTCWLFLSRWFGVLRRGRPAGLLVGLTARGERDRPTPQRQEGRTPFYRSAAVAPGGTVATGAEVDHSEQHYYADGRKPHEPTRPARAPDD